MKKRIIAAALVSIFAAASLFAIDFDFVIGQKTGASLEFANTSGDFKPKFLFNVDAELDMDISDGHGVVVAVNPYSEGGSVEFALSAGYGYRTSISRNTDFLFSVGPTFIFSGSGVGFGIFLDANFDFILTDLVFIRVGTGVELNFGEFGSQEFGQRDLEMVIPLPYIGVGFMF